LGMMAVLKLFVLGLVAARAIARRRHGGDVLSVMVEPIHVALLRLMALHTADALPRMGAALPVVDDAGCTLLMAIDALLRVGRNHNARLADFRPLAAHFHVLHENERHEKQAAEAADNVPFGFQSHVDSPFSCRVNPGKPLTSHRSPSRSPSA